MTTSETLLWDGRDWWSQPVPLSYPSPESSTLQDPSRFWALSRPTSSTSHMTMWYGGKCTRCTTTARRSRHLLGRRFGSRSRQRDSLWHEEFEDPLVPPPFWPA